MKRRSAFPSEVFVWTVLAPRIEAHLTERKLTILELMGLYRLFGPPGAGFSGRQKAMKRSRNSPARLLSLFVKIWRSGLRTPLLSEKPVVHAIS